MFLFLLVHVGKDEIIKNKVKGNEDEIRLLRVLDKYQNVRYRYFVATPRIWGDLCGKGGDLVVLSIPLS